MSIHYGGEIGSVIGLGVGAEEFCDLGEGLVERGEGEVACGSFEGVGDGEGGVEIVGFDGCFERCKVGAVEDFCNQAEIELLVVHAAGETFGGVYTCFLQCFDGEHGFPPRCCFGMGLLPKATVPGI